MRKFFLILLTMITTSCIHSSNLFVRDENADSNGAYEVSDIEVAPLFLVSTFGKASEGDELRVSGSFTFRSSTGEVFTIHDYKQTTIWSEDEGLPTPEVFWASDKPQELTIGASGHDATNFKKWILMSYAAWKEKGTTR